MHRDMYTRTPYGQGYSGQTGAIVLFDSMCEDLVHTGVGLRTDMSVVDGRLRKQIQWRCSVSLEILLQND